MLLSGRFDARSRDLNRPLYLNFFVLERVMPGLLQARRRSSAPSSWQSVLQWL